MTKNHWHSVDAYFHDGQGAFHWSFKMYVNRHFSPASWWYRDVELRKYYRLRLMVFRAVVASAMDSFCVSWVEVHRPFASPACPQIHYRAILARKASGHMVLTNHSQVSFHCSPYIVMPKKLNTRHGVFSDLSARCLHQVLCFLYCSAQKPSFCYFSHIEGQAHVGLSPLSTASLPCCCSRHVEFLNHIRFHRLCWGHQSLFYPLSRMLVRKFFGKNPSAHDIMRFHYADGADKVLSCRWRLPITGGNKLVT
jgi:hypothetical protein